MAKLNEVQSKFCFFALKCSDQEQREHTNDCQIQLQNRIDEQLYMFKRSDRLLVLVLNCHNLTEKHVRINITAPLLRRIQSE